MQSKMVDYAIYLRSNPLIEHIRGMIQELPQKSQFLNQTMQPSLRYVPIAINIDTKGPFADHTADVHNVIWSGAGLYRLRQLLQRNGRQKERIPTMPVLDFRGHELSLSGIQEMDDHNVCRLKYPKLKLLADDFAEVL